jgi:aminodeoxyfutalosine synthase
MSLEQAWDKLRSRASQPLTEVHVVNGLHRTCRSTTTRRCCAASSASAVHSSQVFHCRRDCVLRDLYGMTDEQSCASCRRRALDSRCPAAAPKCSAERVRRKIAHDKCDADRYLAIHKLAHGLGLRTNITMLYGHIETVEERVDHMLRTRALQDETGGLQAFIPLAFHPDNQPDAQAPAPSGVETLGAGHLPADARQRAAHQGLLDCNRCRRRAVVAVVRGQRLDGTTVQEERIYHMAGSDTPEAMTTTAIRRLIRAAGREPVERDTRTTSSPAQRWLR